MPLRSRITRYSLACLAICLGFCAPLAAFADDTSDFLAFKDPTDAMGPMALQGNAQGLTGLKALVDTPQLWRTRLSSNVAQVRAPVSSGLFTPRNTGGQVSLLSSSKTRADGSSNFDLSVFSQPLDVPAITVIPAQAAGSLEQNYNLGLQLGISGFNLGAAVSKVSGSAYDLDATGLDVDMSYSWASWRTSLALRGMSADDQNIGTLGRALGLVHDQSFAVELGAAYDILPGLSFGGSLRFSGFKDNTFFGDDVTTDSAVFLGTKVSF